MSDHESAVRDGEWAPDLADGGAEEGYDALAELFLGAQNADAPPARSVSEAGPYRFPGPVGGNVPATCEVEGLLAGHLPVLASAWVSQYARHRSREAGRPVALVQYRGGRVRIDLHGARPEDAAPASTHDLEAGIRQAKAAGAVWLVHVDEPDEPRLAECDVDSLTLLTGADQAAIVGCYRVIKRLAGACDEDAYVRPVRIAAMGASEEDARRMGESIRRASATFLGRSVELSGVVGRIEAGRAATMVERETDWPIERLIEAIKQHHAGSPVPARSAAPDEVSSVPPAPAPQKGTVAAKIEGLSPVAILCPIAPTVELAQDGAGRLHLTTFAESESAVEHLLSTREWATSHAALLAAASPGLDASSPEMHLVTRDARCVRHLLDTCVRIHLAISVDGECCAPLN